MRYGLFLVALLMLIYVLASFLGSGYIGIIYFPVYFPLIHLLPLIEIANIPIITIIYTTTPAS